MAAIPYSTTYDVTYADSAHVTFTLTSAYVYEIPCKPKSKPAIIVNGRRFKNKKLAHIYENELRNRSSWYCPPAVKPTVRLFEQTQIIRNLGRTDYKRNKNKRKLYNQKI